MLHFKNLYWHSLLCDVYQCYWNYYTYRLIDTRSIIYRSCFARQGRHSAWSKRVPQIWRATRRKSNSKSVKTKGRDSHIMTRLYTKRFGNSSMNPYTLWSFNIAFYVTPNGQDTNDQCCDCFAQDDSIISFNIWKHWNPKNEFVLKERRIS